MKRFAVAVLIPLAQLLLGGAQAAEPIAIGQTGTDEVTIAFQFDGRTTYIHRHIDRSRWQYKTCAAQMAASAPGNAASVFQNGARNGAAIAQRGQGDLASTTQNGIGNAAFTTQRGVHDFTSVSQQGTNWTVSVGQSGACDIAIAVQTNAGMFAPMGPYAAHSGQHIPRIP